MLPPCFRDGIVNPLGALCGKQSMFSCVILFPSDACCALVLKLRVDPSTSHPSDWPYNDDLLLRKTDWEKFQLELVAYRVAETTQAERKCAVTSDSLSPAVQEENEQRERVMERCHAAMQRFPAIMEFAVLLIRWKSEYDREYKSIKKRNQTWTKNLAEREGWDPGDLVASQTYGSLQRRKNFLLEKIGSTDVSPIRSTIESELLAVQARRQRQKAEATYRAQLTQVKEIYERMRCGTLKAAHTGPGDPTGALILPPLSVFCTLPSVRVLKGSP
ncbi:hypothetical protein J3R83DRAFT_5034 [Lanmaoa asiatica]|nr:hypothetical protein J3R83DRAFT_5034 [Lanmaoa asiatica]